MSPQGVVAAALLDPGLPCPAGLTAWNGSDPAPRFGVYRNNVIVSLVDALADTFAVTQELVGEDFFRAMARLYAFAHPPKSPLLAFYGAGFPGFIARFPPAAGVPYLADVARLEFLRVHAYHAADVVPASASDIAAILPDEAALPALRVALHPSLGVHRSRFAVVSLWAAHQGLRELSSVRPGVPETALVLRRALEVVVMEIPCATGCFIDSLQNGATLGAAVDAAGTSHADFDLTATLALLLQKDAVTEFYLSRENP